MKRILCLVITVVMLTFTFTACTEPLSDDPAPDFTVMSADGKNVKLSEFFGKPIVVNFWGTWCGYCVQELPEFQKVYEELGEDVQFLMVNYGDTLSDVDNFLTTNTEYNFPIYFDTNGNAVDTYQVTGFPTTVFIRANGEVATVRSGALSESVLRSCITQIFDKK